MNNIPSYPYPHENFNKHLLLNKRILFSGKFGTGKTFFLKEFFTLEAIKDKYVTFHLFPVNYQVASNEDIFSLLKYDILYHIIGFGWLDKDDEAKISHTLAVQNYFMNNSYDFISGIMKCIPFFNINVYGKAMEELKKFFNQYSTYYKKLNESNLDLVNEFASSIEHKPGGLYEIDQISNFIYECLDNNKKRTLKESVLIVDDLDRIDPEHIFRILNIFSAHFDRSLYNNNENKFGFDKIIFVGDIKNIRNIFLNRYGENTDFTGYIDKFYSNSIIEFNNTPAISNYFTTKFYEIYNNEEVGYDYQETGIIKDITSWLINANQISFRQILCLPTTKTVEEFYKYDLAITKMNICLQKIILILRIFLYVFENDINMLKKAFLAASKTNTDRQEVSHHIKYMLFGLNYNVLRNQDISSKFEYVKRDMNLKILYSTTSGYGQRTKITEMKVLYLDNEDFFDPSYPTMNMDVPRLCLLYCELIDILYRHRHFG